MDSSTDAAGAEGLGFLPCLNSNISIEIPLDETLNTLSTQHRKTAFVLSESIYQLAERYGVQRLGFLTLTFSDHVTCPREAQKRFNSLVSNVVKKRYLEYVGCMERQKNGRIHFHLLVVLKSDIRTGVDFAALASKNYSTAPLALRNEWAFWRKTARNYRFGRTELLPIKTNIEAMAKYVGKYIAKHVEARDEADKGARLVRYSKGARAGNTRFMFNSQGSAEWRRKVALFAAIVQSRHPGVQIACPSDISAVVGKRWAYRNRDFILSL